MEVSREERGVRGTGSEGKGEDCSEGSALWALLHTQKQQPCSSILGDEQKLVALQHPSQDQVGCTV